MFSQTNVPGAFDMSCRLPLADEFSGLQAALVDQSAESLQKTCMYQIVKFGSVVFSSTDRFLCLLLERDPQAWVYLLGAAALRAPQAMLARLYGMSPFSGEDILFVRNVGEQMRPLGYLSKHADLEFFLQERELTDQNIRRAVAVSGTKLEIGACYLVACSEGGVRAHFIPTPDMYA